MFHLPRIAEMLFIGLVKKSIRIFHKIVWKNPNRLFDQPNISFILSTRKDNISKDPSPSCEVKSVFLNLFKTGNRARYSMHKSSCPFGILNL